MKTGRFRFNLLAAFLTIAAVLTILLQCDLCNSVSAQSDRDNSSPAAPTPAIPFSKNNQPSLGGGRMTQPVSRAYSNDFLNAILPQLSDFASRAGLSVPVPVTTNQVDMPRYFCGLLGGQPYAQIYLKNGDRFNYEHGHVCAFYGHDAFNKFPYEGNPDEFMGKVNMTTNDAIAAAGQALRKLGYKGPLPTPAIETRQSSGSKEFTRRIFLWWHSPSVNSAIASVEFDMETKAIKSIYCDDPSLWRDPPKVDVPLTK